MNKELESNIMINPNFNTIYLDELSKLDCPITKGLAKKIPQFIENCMERAVNEVRSNEKTIHN